jgi:hypothetical protein
MSTPKVAAPAMLKNASPTCAFTARGSADPVVAFTTRAPTMTMPVPTLIPDHAIPPYSSIQKWPTMPTTPMATQANAT